MSTLGWCITGHHAACPHTITIGTTTTCQCHCHTDEETLNGTN